MEFLMIELVHTLRESARTAMKKSRTQEEEMVAAGLLPAPASSSITTPSLRGSSSVRDSMASEDSKVFEEEEDALKSRLESIGAVVGGNLAERLSRDKTRFQDTLDTIKFICKDLWTVMWDKQVDNLRTNHRGIYVLQDNAFKPLVRFSSPGGSAEALKRARIYLAFPAGVIRGALMRFGHNASVTLESLNVPQCSFQVKLHKGP